MSARASLFALLLAATCSEAAGRSWDFRVFLDGSEIGRHTFSQHAEADGLRLVSEARFEVRFLAITAYRYSHRAEEQWRGGCLEGLRARTQTNSDVEVVSMRAEAGRWRVERGRGNELHEGCIKTFAYWDPAILKAPRLLNAQTGELLPVKSVSLGAETVAVRGRPTDTVRHRLTAPRLEIDLWYAAGEWVALESTTEGGRRLRYELI